jgi:DNA-binding transcriptional ArsR family regulator
MIVYAPIRIYSSVNMITQTLKQEISQLEANLCSAFADPTRILILYALDERSRNVTELTNELGTTQSTTSRHLKILRERGLVHTTRQGTTITYELADDRLIEALDILRTVLRDNINVKANLVAEFEIK